MANRYWVGGTASWDSTAGTKWASTSGGAGGQSVPGISDDVFFDANSGNVTVTISTPANTLSLNFSGFTGTIQVSNGVTIYGNLTLSSSMTFTAGSSFSLRATSGTQTITSNGKSLGANSLVVNGIGGTVKFADAFVSTSSITLTNGTLDFNNQDVQCLAFGSSSSNTRTLTLGSGTFTLTTTGTIWNTSTTTNLTFNVNTSTIKVTNNSSTGLTFAGGGLTFNKVWFSRGTGTGSITITGANTFNEFKDDGTGSHVIIFPASTTQTFTTFNVNGASASTLITLNSSSTGTAFTLSKSSGTVTVDYLSIKDSTATGGATWNANYTCANVSGNTGWNFLPFPSNTNFIPFL